MCIKDCITSSIFQNILLPYLKISINIPKLCVFVLITFTNINFYNFFKNKRLYLWYMMLSKKSKHLRLIKIKVIRTNTHNLGTFIDILRYGSKMQILIHMLSITYILTISIADSRLDVTIVGYSYSSKCINYG
jgi:hypothetical protein